LEPISALSTYLAMSQAIGIGAQQM